MAFVLIWGYNILQKNEPHRSLQNKPRVHGGPALVLGLFEEEEEEAQEMQEPQQQQYQKVAVLWAAVKKLKLNYNEPQSI